MATKPILETKDYTKFELLSFNRDVTKISRLEDSMRNFGWLDAYPMFVVKNGSKLLRIKDGHNRFTAARNIEIPIKYVVGEDCISVYDLNKTHRVWTLADYLIAHVREGHHPYLVIKKYQERTGIGLGDCISMLYGESAGSHNKIEEFKTGRYQLGDPTHAEIVAELVIHLRSIGISWAHNNNLVRAFSRIARVPELEVRRMKSKLKAHPYLIQKQPTVDTYVAMLESIYNSHSQEKIPIAFFAEQTQKSRSATSHDK